MTPTINATTTIDPIEIPMMTPIPSPFDPSSSPPPPFYPFLTVRVKVEVPELEIREIPPT